MNSTDLTLRGRDRARRFGEAIHAWRTAHDLDVRAAARLIGVSALFLGDVEAYRTDPRSVAPSFAMLFMERTGLMAEQLGFDGPAAESLPLPPPLEGRDASPAPAPISAHFEVPGRVVLEAGAVRLTLDLRAAEIAAQALARVAKEGRAAHRRGAARG